LFPLQKQISQAIIHLPYSVVLPDSFSLKIKQTNLEFPYKLILLGERNESSL
jgi:hypothetical protein